MSLRFVYGASGSGKTNYIFNDVIEKSKDLSSDYIMIVPEQFTMETQKDIVTKHPCGGAVNIDILSFERFAFNVFNELFINVGSVLDDTGKNLVLRKVIEHEKNNLQIFGNKSSKEGFTSEMKSLISEFYQYGIGEDEIDRILSMNDVSPLLKGKISDVKHIFEAFKKEIGRDYIPSEELLRVLCDNISDSEIVKKSEFYFDGFTGFTPVQYRLIGHIMKYAKKVTISVTLPSYKANDTKQKEQDLFLMSIKTRNVLMNEALMSKVIVEDAVCMDDENPIRYKESKALSHLEKNLFRFKKQSFDEEQDDVKILEFATMNDEISSVAGTIKSLVMDEGYRYKDIAIVTADIDEYHKLIENTLTKADIPFFIDNKRNITDNPFVDSIKSMLEIVTSNFSYESLFRFLRRGMTGIKTEEIDKLENAVLAMGIRGFDGYNREWSKSSEEVNQVREKIVNIFSDIYAKLSRKNVTVSEITMAIYEFIESLNMNDIINSYAEKFQLDNELALAKEYSQIYRLVMELFEKITALMGNERISLKEYADILDAGFEEIKVGIIPPSPDCVLAGDIERTRLNNIKALFFVGVNDSVVPKSAKQGGILSEKDRRILKKVDVELSPSARENAFIQKFYLYLNMTKPKNKLYVSYALVNLDGKSHRKSYIIGELMKVFGKLKIVADHKDFRYLVGEDAALDYLASKIRDILCGDEDYENNQFFKDLLAYYIRENDREKLESYVEAATFRYLDNPIDEAVARVLYGKEMTNSISRLEKYANCAYSHFLRYGLNLLERKIYEIKISDIGTLYHAALEEFSNRVNEKYSWSELDEPTRTKLVKESVEKISADEEAAVFSETERSRYMLERLYNMTNKTTKVICEQIKGGQFVPAYFELKFSDRMKIDEDTNMNLYGVIDRVDICREIVDGRENIYVKVVDYKSGKKEFKMNDIYDGRSLQLSMYMKEVLELEKRKNPDATVIPAAELYYMIKDPVIDKYNESGIDDSEERRKKEYVMPGLVNNDPHIVKLIDERLESQSSSSVIEVKKNKDGEFKIKNSTSTYGFEMLSAFMEKKTKRLAKEIVSGSVSINPVKDSGKTPCDYCEFSGVCRFDMELSGFEYRKACKLKNEEVWSNIKDEYESRYEKGGSENA